MSRATSPEVTKFVDQRVVNQDGMQNEEAVIVALQCAKEARLRLQRLRTAAHLWAFPLFFTEYQMGAFTQKKTCLHYVQTTWEFFLACAGCILLERMLKASTKNKAKNTNTFSCDRPACDPGRSAQQGVQNKRYDNPTPNMLLLQREYVEEITTKYLEVLHSNRAAPVVVVIESNRCMSVYAADQLQLSIHRRTQH